MSMLFVDFVYFISYFLHLRINSPIAFSQSQNTPQNGLLFISSVRLNDQVIK